MTATPNGSGKLPGKTIYAGRRRAMTRTSGFSVHKDTTGGEFSRHLLPKIALIRGDRVNVTFLINGHSVDDLLGYGMWFWHTSGITCTLTGGPDKRTLTEYSAGSWNKIGSVWKAQDDEAIEVTVTLVATASAEIAIYKPLCGRISHRHLDDAREVLLRNMYQFAPEAIFIDDTSAGEVEIEVSSFSAGLTVGEPPPQKRYVANPVPAHSATLNTSDSQALILKSCNRCGRYLPVNVPAERDQLSFSNHCVAEHRRPCSHATFGRLRNVDGSGETLKLDYGYQLECRFCKKFEVNAAHNPQRSSAQMKEDGARRRAFELLLAELYGGIPQLRYRQETGSELSDDIWKRFGCACFNCGADLPTARDMRLDHTRPLALLWPLDGTATALCGSCNSEKRDRAPCDFYSPEKLLALADITGIPIETLSQTHPNEQALDFLLTRLDWFFDVFLLRREMTKERDGKITGELVVKALHKVLARSAKRRAINLKEEYDRRRRARRG